MTLDSLQHLVRAVRALADDCEVIVLGSASLLATWPDLGIPGAPLASTFDADLCPQPFDETTARMLEEAMGEERAFHSRHGYHADILRDKIFETFPLGWQSRLVPVPDCTGANAIDPHDIAAIKLLIGRDKDIELVRYLGSKNLLSKDVVRQRLDSIQKPDRALITSQKAFDSAFS